MISMKLKIGSLVDLAVLAAISLMTLQLWLVPTHRDIREGNAVLIALAVMVFVMRDWWLKAFALTSLLSFGFHQPRMGVSIQQIVYMLIFISVIDRLVAGSYERIYAKALTALSLLAGGMYLVGLIFKSTFWPLDNPILQGPMMAISSPIALAYGMPYPAVIFAALALVTKSTTAVLCLLAAYAAYALNKSAGKVVTHVAQVAAVVAFVLFIDRYHRFSVRWIMLSDSMEMARSKLTGFGLGAFMAMSPKTWGPVFSGKYWGHAHCEPAQVFFELGYLPFAVVIAFVLRTVWLSHKTAYDSKAMLISGSMLAFIIFALLGFPMHFGPSIALFGIAYVLYRRHYAY